MFSGKGSDQFARRVVWNVDSWLEVDCFTNFRRVMQMHMHYLGRTDFRGIGDDDFCGWLCRCAWHVNMALP